MLLPFRKERQHIPPMQILHHSIRLECPLFHTPCPVFMVCDGDIVACLHGIHDLREEVIAWNTLHLEAVVNRQAYRHVLHHAQVVEEPKSDRVRFSPCRVDNIEPFPFPVKITINDNPEVFKYSVNRTVEQSFGQIRSLRQKGIIIPHFLQFRQCQSISASYQCVNNPYQPFEIPFVHA